jgi:hypothetical protein
MLLVDHQVFGHVLGHSHDFIALAAAAEGAGAIIDGARHGSDAPFGLAVADLDLPSQWILPLP